MALTLTKTTFVFKTSEDGDRTFGKLASGPEKRKLM